MIKAYIDNSVLSELRKQGLQQKNKRKLIFNICKKFTILAKNCIITDKLFLELIYCGNIRKQIVKDYEANIIAIQSKIYQPGAKENIEKNINDLEQFFDQKFRIALPVSKISDMAITTLRNNPFAYRFRIFNKKILAYANNISKDTFRYNQFILSLVVDSVVRYALLEPASKINDDIFIKVAMYLLKKYRSITKELLLIFTAASKSKEEALRKMKDKARLIRPRDDFADVEPQYLVFYGKNINGRRYPITFLSSEPIEKIQDRMDYYFGAGIVEIARNSPSQNEALLLGTSLIINFKNFKYTEIASGLFLKKISRSSYRVLG
jgi:hypothetical protein